MTCDIRSWNCFSFLIIISGFLLERVLYQEAVSSTLVLMFEPSVAPALVLILDRFYPRHFWLAYVRDWKVAAERSWGWQEGLKKAPSVIQHLPAESEKQFFFFKGLITTLRKKKKKERKKYLLEGGSPWYKTLLQDQEQAGMCTAQV